MIKQLKTIAILSENDAFASILRMIIADNNGLRVRIFNSEVALANYMNITPIDLLITDCDEIDYAQITTISYLRTIAQSPGYNFALGYNFASIALCKKVQKNIKSFCETAKIDELIVKPMSPIYLEARVLALLNRENTDFAKNSYKNIERRRANINIQKPFSGDNVIALFAEDRPTKPLSHIE